MKKGKRLLCGALALLLVLSLTAVGTVQRAYATKSEEDQAAEEQKKAEEAAQRQAEMEEAGEEGSYRRAPEADRRRQVQERGRHGHQDPPGPAESTADGGDR